MTAGSKARESNGETDMRVEREQFLRTFLHKGVELTEGLLNENQTLEQQLAELREENVRLRAQLVSDDVVRELLARVEGLERDRRALLGKSGELEREYAQHSARHAEVEQELNNLAGLYIASSQLGATLSVERVVRHMCELLEQLVGAQSFVVYVLSGTRAIPVGFRGYSAGQVAPIAVEEGMIADVCLTGVARVLDPEQQRNASEPLAVLPLVFSAEVVGVIAIYKLLGHKPRWAHLDRELFKLLCSQGATALIAANLYAKEVGPRAALHDVLVHLENERHRLLTEAESEVGGDV